MLSIRLKRTGRTGHAQFRLIAQDRRFSPARGRIAAYLGSYDPHTKVASIDKDKVAELLAKGAQPSPRAVKLLEKEGVKLPAWVVKAAPRKSSIRNPEKLRKNRPADAEVKDEAKPVDEASDSAVEETVEAGEPAAEKPSEQQPAAEEKASDEKSEPTKEPEVSETVSEAPTEEKSQDSEAKPEASAETKDVKEAPIEPAVEDQPKAES